MDAEIKESVLKALMYLRANLTDPHGGRAPLTKITDATVGALDAWKEAGAAAARHYQALARMSERADNEQRDKAKAARVGP